MKSEDLSTQHIPDALLPRMISWLEASCGGQGAWDVELVKSVGPVGRQRQIMRADNHKTGQSIGLKTNSSARQTKAEFDALWAMKNTVSDSVTPLHLDPEGQFFALEWVDAPVLNERIRSGDRAAATREAGEWLARLHNASRGMDVDNGQKREISLPFWTGFGPVGRARRRMRRRLGQLTIPPKSSVLLHGDFHPGNLFDTPDGLIGFDRSANLVGLPYFDVAKYLIFIHSLRALEKRTGVKVAGSEAGDRKAFFEGYGPIPVADLPLYDLVEDTILFRKWRSAFTSGSDRYDLEMQNRGLFGPKKPEIRPLRLVSRGAGETEWVSGPVAP